LVSVPELLSATEEFEDVDDDVAAEEATWVLCVVWAETVEPLTRCPGESSSSDPEADPDDEPVEEPADELDAELDEEPADELDEEPAEEELDEPVSSAAATPNCGPTRDALHNAAPIPAEATPTRSQLRTANASARRARCRPDIIDPPDNLTEQTVRCRVTLRNG
jgi:hypothetical protein